MAKEEEGSQKPSEEKSTYSERGRDREQKGNRVIVFFSFFETKSRNENEMNKLCMRENDF